MEKMFQAVRATQATLSFDKFVSLVLSEVSDEDENSVGAMAAKSEAGPREKMEPIRIMPV